MSASSLRNFYKNCNGKSSGKGENNLANREARLRHKLLTNELNPIADFLLSIVLIFVTPCLWIFSVIHDKLMFMFLNKHYIYNVSWEDPRMDQRVFDLNEDDHVITIASAGCNVLDYIIEGAMVTAVDFNSCQIALTELKKVAILNVDYEVFFKIFSESNMEVLREVYPLKLRPHLSTASREFWDAKIHVLKSFMYSGTSGKMAYFIFRVVFPLLGMGFIRDGLLNNISKEEMNALFVKNGYVIRAVAWLVDNIAFRAGCCFAGVPERQMQLGLHRPNNMGIVFEKIFFNTDLCNDNYFFAGYILGHYKSHNCPRYLRKENFLKMRKHLENNKLVLVHGTILQAINMSTKPITVASLLDHMDWMTDRMINEEITHLIRKMDPVRGKIFWRTFADGIHAAPLTWLNPTRVDDYDDRVGMYWTTYITHLKDVLVAYEDRVDTMQEQGLLSKLVVGAKIVSYPFLKPFISRFTNENSNGHANKMEAFYRFQKNGYDAFREGLLHARGPLMEAFPLWKRGEMVWIDVGGGTARNLEYFPVEVIRKYFKHIYILDISKSLLEIAQKRVNAMGLSDIVTVVEHDFTADSVFEVMPEANSVDVITMSYSYSMIPNQAAALRNSAKLLKPEGDLLLADFFLFGNYDSCLPRMSRLWRHYEAIFHKNWFAMDHVHLLAEKQLQLADDSSLERVWDNRFRGAVPLLPMLQPYHGVVVFRNSV